MNYDDLKKKLGIKSIPNQTPIVKVVEEEKLDEPTKTNTVIPKESDTIAEDERKYHEIQTNKSLPETPFENKNNPSTKEKIIGFKTEAERKFKQESAEPKIEKETTPNPVFYNKMFSAPFSFNGRIRRTEYGLSLIVFYLIIVGITILRISYITNYIPFKIYFVFSMLFNGDTVQVIISIILFWFLLAQGAKRCHDRGNSGWFQIIPYYLFWMLFAKGEAANNKYSNSPKTNKTKVILVTFLVIFISLIIFKIEEDVSDIKAARDQEEYYRALRVADSAAAVEAIRVDDSNRVADSLAAIEAIGARVEDSIRDLKQAATQLENEKKLRIEAVKIFKRFDKKNLNVSKYRNGDAIPQVQDADAWSNLTTGAWCYYDNKKSYGTKYGKLYNWYAVNDPRGLAPKGYHIPTDEEWTILTDNLGDEAGTKMKSTTGWEYGNGTNTSGFAGLPGGYRYSNGNFFNIGAIGNWWSSSESYAYGAWSRYLGNNNGNVNRYNYDKHYGFSVRCLRD